MPPLADDSCFGFSWWRGKTHRSKLWTETVVKSALATRLGGDWSNADISPSLSLSCVSSVAECSFFADGKLHHLVHELLSPLPVSLWDCPFSVCSCHILKVKKCGRNIILFQVFFLKCLFSEDATVKDCTTIGVVPCRRWVFHTAYWVLKSVFIATCGADITWWKKILKLITGNWFWSIKTLHFD